MRSPKKALDFLERTGQYLVIAGILGFAAAIVLSLIPKAISYVDGIASDGTIASVSFIFLLMGAAFALPGLLRENSKDEQSYSTMRFVVLAIVLVFSAITIKIGWQTSSFEDFKINTTWVYILGLAFGAKVAQTFNEEDPKSTVTDSDEEEDTEEAENNEKGKKKPGS